MYGSALAGLGALAPDIKDTKSASVIVMAPLIIGYMFLVPMTLDPNGPVALVISIFPLTAPVGMICRMSSTDVPTWQVVLSIVLQLMTAFVTVRSTVRLFRAQTLLSGQTFTTARFFRSVLSRG